MKTFGGEFSKQQKVSLSGKSKGVAESREEILERARRERDARRQRKVEQGAALCIQAAWRSYWGRVVVREGWRNSWIGMCGDCVSKISDGNGDAGVCMGMVVMFVDPDDLDDVERFSWACEMYCRGLERRESFWIKYILQMAVRCLSAQKDVFSPYMRRSLSSLTDQVHTRVGMMAKRLIGCVLHVLSLETKKETGGILDVSLLRLCLNAPGRDVLFRDIADIVRVSTVMRDTSSVEVSSAESMLTSLLVYMLSRDEKSTVLSPGIVDILLVDSIFKRCLSLEPLSSKIWKSAMRSLEECDIRCIVPQGCIESLLANLIQCLENLMARGVHETSVPKKSLVFFMGFVEKILEDRSYWNVSATNFVHPLAEANVMIFLVSALENDVQQYGGNTQRHETMETICRFVTRLVSYSNDSVVQTKITLTLAVKANLANLLWTLYLRDYDVPRLTSESFHTWMPSVILFCETCAASLNVLGDFGFYGKGVPLSPTDIYDSANPQRGVLYILKELLWKVVWKETALAQKHLSCDPELRTRFLKSGGKLLTLLHDKNGRRPFAPREAFYANDLPRESFHAAAVAAIDRRDIEKMHSDLSGMGDDSDSEVEPSNRIVEILQYAYPLVPFLERVRVFQSIVMSERRKIGNDESISGIMFGGMSRDRFIVVHRGRVLEDAFAALGLRRSDVDVKKRIRISFVNEFGENEAGIDGGGVFKEFLECIIKESISPAMGLFESTMDNKLYPASIEPGVYANEKLKKMEFVGMMIGKALWEGILLELPLATFFLKKIRGTASSSGVDDLPSLDPELAKHLSYLMDNLATVGELGLTFSITQSSMDKTKDIELIPGGSNIPVTSANVAHFIHRTANFRLNEQIKSSSDSFLRGFHAIIPKEWVSCFNDSELQMLIGGAEGSATLNLGDLKSHVLYTGGYDAHHPVIKMFWKALESFTNAQLADFLRFVTSCPRPPILGFSSLEPPLTIQMAGGSEGDIERLPTAATCVNLLKLPPYRSEEVLRTKLLYSIQAHAGFDLS